MTFKPAIWYPIAVVLSAANLVAVGVYAAEPGHAAMHAALALAFGFWAQRLRKDPGGGGGGPPARPEGRDARGGGERPGRLEASEAEVSRLGQELSETQERLDFAERVLAQGRETHRVGPQR